MGKGGMVGSKQYSKRGIQSKDKGSDESDDDYTVGEDEEFNDSEEYCSSLVGEESEENLAEFGEDEEENERMVVKSKGRKFFPDRKKNEVGKARKRRMASYKVEDDEDFEVEEEEEDYDDEEDDVEEEEEFAKKRRASHKVEDDEDFDEDYDDDDDDDDEEFAPDEIDLDDEDELVVRKKNKKVRRPSLREKGLVKGRKRKRNSEAMKKCKRKNSTKSIRLRGKPAARNYGALKEKNPVVKERSKKSSGRKKMKFMADADSDFMSSGSSDFEYSISEEEREQVKEASKICRDLTPNLRNSCPIERLQEEVLSQQRIRTGRKGKEKVEELKNEAGKQVCGICLSEEGKTTVRGTLNCCSHYFCFACIMEWSKVESRCPLCKQRFVNISKPARSNAGFGLRTVVVQVPERDQVYQPTEEELRGYLDPYENVICTECQLGGDDAFMLLCDICDSPAHTYCIGLGREVPEGNWYCEGCRPTALGYSNPQAPSPTFNHRTISNLSDRSFSHENIREAIDLNSEYVPETPTQGTGIFSSPRHPVGDAQAGSPVSGAGVSTLSGRRRILQIHHLLNNRLSEFGGRTNWVSAATSGSSILGSQVDRGREMAFQHAITPERFSSQQNISHGRLQHNFAPSFQSRDLSWARSSHSRDHLIRGQTSTSADGSVNRMLQQAGLAGISRGINSRSGNEQLHPCSSSRSSIADDSMSPYRYREATVPSRTLPGSLRTPF